MASGKEFRVTVSPSETVIERLLVAVFPTLEPCTLKLFVPVAVGVPEIRPCAETLRPVGRLPLNSTQE